MRKVIIPVIATVIILGSVSPGWRSSHLSSSSVAQRNDPTTGKQVSLTPETGVTRGLTRGSLLLHAGTAPVSMAARNAATGYMNRQGSGEVPMTVLDFAASGTLLDQTGATDVSDAFREAYMNATQGQAIVVPAGKYRVDEFPKMITARGAPKYVAWVTQNATGANGGDLFGLMATGTLIEIPNQMGNVTIAGPGIVPGVHAGQVPKTSTGAGDIDISQTDKFGGDSLKVNVMSSGSAILGYAYHSAPAGSQGFPGGVNGLGDLRSPGGQVFGIYGMANLYAHGTATNEFDAYNYVGVPSALLPPNRSFNTTENNAVSVTVGGGSGTYPASIGIDIEKSGSGMLTGIYEAPDAAINNGFLIDATSTVGPLNPLTVRLSNYAEPVQIASLGTYSAAKAVQTWSAGGLPRATVLQDGTYQNRGARLGGDGRLALSSGLSVAAGSVVLPTGTPASSSAPCVTGQRLADSNYDYVCVSTNTWKRAALSTF